MRIFELAKALGVNSKGLVTLCKDMKDPVKSHMSVISEELWYKLQDRMNVSEDKRIPYKKKPVKKRSTAKKATSVTSKTRKNTKTVEKGPAKSSQDSDQEVLEAQTEEPQESVEPSVVLEDENKLISQEKTTKGKTTQDQDKQSKIKIEKIKEDRVLAPKSDIGLIKKAKDFSPSVAQEDLDEKNHIEEVRERVQDRQGLREDQMIVGGVVRTVQDPSRSSKRQALQNRVASRRGRRKKIKGEVVKVDRLNVKLPITVRQLSSDLHIKVNDIINNLKNHDGTLLTVEDEINEEQLITLGLLLNIDISVETESDTETALFDKNEERETQTDEDLYTVPRPPVVTVLGHVDHGKTSLLDYIRKSRVAARESGGITQHIGAYQVQHHGKAITFIDTPGHQIFTEMRARGAQSTDIVILVVAADDGVMPQTEESIQHARAANVPIIVAINKIDKEGANLEKIKQQLTQHELIAEDWGGQTILCPVSAITGEGIDHLLEMILLQTEVMELKANPELSYARGIVLESTISKQKGVVATFMVQNGTLHKGDIVVCGSTYGKVRALIDENNKQHDSGGPSSPLQVIGLNEAPEVGSQFIVVSDIAKAREIAQFRSDKAQQSQHQEQQEDQMEFDLDQAFDALDDQGYQELSLIIKADVRGSLEALINAIEAITTTKVPLKIISKGIGGISESDVILAKASESNIIGFGVVADAKARKAAKSNNIDIKLYSIVYELLDDLKATMEGRVASEQREDEIGQAKVRAVFNSSKFGMICGCIVSDGVVRRNSHVRVSRNGVVIHKGVVESLRRFKDDVKEVKEGFECGIRVKDYDDIKADDSIHFFEVVEVAGVLE